MEYALHNGLRTAAQPKLTAICEHCGCAVQAKCGTKKVWHWAHLTTVTCDSWYEPETLWHRNWKNRFGEAYCEIRVVKNENYHIADVINKDEIVFEFQNSSISSDMIVEREDFYGEKMLWIINAEPFTKNFKMYDDDYLNNWKVKFLDEFDSLQNYKPFSNGLIIEDWQIKNEHVKNLLEQFNFVHLIDTPIYYFQLNGTESRRTLERTISDEIMKFYNKHAPLEDFKKGKFFWAHARRSWEDAKRPVFIDFGFDYLYRITSGIGKETGTGVKISKQKFIEKYCS